MKTTVEILENKPMIVARMKMTIPDYSKNLALMAVKTMKNELRSKGVTLADPAYDYLVSYDSTYRIEVIDIEINVAVKDKAEDSEMIQFVDLPAVEKLIRITADKFEDIHIGLAEWMHENDYIADGLLRTVIQPTKKFVYDCPVKPAEF